MFTLYDEISQDTFVRAGLPSPTFPAACANKDGFYYKTIQSRYTMKLDLMRKQSQSSYEKTLHLQPPKKNVQKWKITYKPIQQQGLQPF